MKFPIQHVAPCLVATDETVAECGIATQPNTGDIEQCADPAFAAANPVLCRNYPRLRIDPSQHTVLVNETVEFTAVLSQGGIERALDDDAGVVWAVSDESVAVIGARSGNVTGVAAGQVEISADWQNLSAAARLTVLAAGGTGTGCQDKHIGVVVVLDKSLSMSQSYGAGYSTKLSYAKAAAKLLAGSLDLTKDSIGLVSFDETAVNDLGMTTDEDAFVAAVDAVDQGQKGTTLLPAVQAAVAVLEAAGNDYSIIALLTDGNDGGLFSGGVPPELMSAVPQTMILAVLGVRAQGPGFSLLNILAAHGFFQAGFVVPNSTGSGLIDNGAKERFAQLKRYFCGCGETTRPCASINKTALNYASFTNWDVTNRVDLIGGVPPWTMFDFLPGNGLYVDLAGSPAPGENGLGRLALKAAKQPTFAAATGYTLTVRLAGNQREETATQVRLKVGTLLTEQVVSFAAADFTDDFAEFEFDFTGDGAAHAVEIWQHIGCTNPSYGNLLKSVTIRNADTDAIVFQDDFNAENYVQLPCGDVDCGEDGFWNGYRCVYRCEDLTVKWSAPLPDMFPLEEIETADTPGFWTSQQTYTRTCDDGLTVTGTGTASSTISQADADRQAGERAAAAAVCPTADLEITDFILIHFERGRFAHDDDSCWARSTIKGLGLIPVGSTEDTWNQPALTWATVSLADGALYLANDTGEQTTVKLMAEYAALNQLCGVAGSQFSPLGFTGPDFYRRCEVAASPNQYRTIFNLPAGTYDVYVWGVARNADGADGSLTTAQLYGGKYTLDVMEAGIDVHSEGTVSSAEGSKEMTLADPDTLSNWPLVENQDYVHWGDVVVPAGGALRVKVEAPSGGGQPVISGIQIQRFT